MPDGAPEDDLREALHELEAALDALRRAQALHAGAKPWSGRAWDVGAAGSALHEAEARLAAARARVAAALRGREAAGRRNGSQAL